MEFPAFEWIRISRKRNISAAREQWGLGQLKCSMGRMERFKRDAYHVGKHSKPTPRLAHVIFYFCLPCDLFSIMDETEVVRIVESTVTKKNENLLASMKLLLDDSLNELKHSHADTADSHLKEIKKLKFDEPHRFKKRGNEDQYRFNLKVSDAIEEAKDACSACQFDKVHASLEKGEKLLTERQKHILLADKSDFGWSLIREYKRNDLAEDSDNEKKIIRAEARARNQAKQSERFKSRQTNRRDPTALTSVAAAVSSQCSGKPIPAQNATSQTGFLFCL